jgi:flagellar hook-associated protein 1 FlgK
LARSQASADSARSNQLIQLEKIFGVGEAGLGYSATQFLNAFTDVSTKPQDQTARQVVLARAGDMASRFNNAAQQIDTMQAGVTQQLQVYVSSVNNLSEQIAALNQRIVDARGLGQPPNDLLDKRDTAINDLSEYIQVSTVAADDGSLSVFLGGGQSLVVGAGTTKLVPMTDPFNATRVVIGVAGQNGNRQLPDSLLSSGSISGLLRFQNGDLTDARNQLGQLALGIGLQVNEQQSLGLDRSAACRLPTTRSRPTALVVSSSTGSVPAYPIQPMRPAPWWMATSSTASRSTSAARRRQAIDICCSPPAAPRAICGSTWSTRSSLQRRRP